MKGETAMRWLLIVSAIVLASACGGRKTPAGWDQLANSEAVKLLRTPDSADRVIYSPPVDLAKKPGS